MKTKNVFIGFLVVFALTLGLVLAGCIPDSGDDGNQFVGTWTGYDPNFDVVRVVLDSTTWTLSWPDYPQRGVQAGTYTYSGNTITFFQSGVAMGTGNVSGNTGTVNITGFGAMTLTRQS